MDILKRHLDMVIIGSSVIVLTLLLLVLIIKTTRQVKELEVTVQEIQNRENDFLKLKYKLDPKNVRLAMENRDLAESSLKKLREQLADHYRILDFTNSSSTPVEFKRNLQNRTEGMCKTLDVHKIDYPRAQLKTFGFDYFLGATVIPNANDIALVHKQLAIYEELIQIISRSGVRSINRLQYRGDAKSPVATDRDLYNFFTYDLQIVGDVNSIQRFTKELNESELLFVVRWSNLMSKDVKGEIVIPKPPTASGIGNPGGSTGPTGPGGMPNQLPGPRPGGSRGRTPPPVAPVAPIVPTSPIDEVAATQLAKKDRLIFKDLTTVTQTMIIDYVEFKK